jgi:hypothetical protein
MTTKRMGYRETLDWLLDNEDLSEIFENDEDERSLSVAAALAADIFGKTDKELERDLIKRKDARNA